MEIDSKTYSADPVLNPLVAVYREAGHSVRFGLDKESVETLDGQLTNRPGSSAGGVADGTVSAGWCETAVYFVLVGYSGSPVVLRYLEARGRLLLTGLLRDR